MKASELRLGNLFTEEYTNSIIQVIQLETDKIFFSLKFVSQWQAKPIPLTEEWLLKFGFEKNFNNFYEKLINKDEDDFIGKLTDYGFAYYIDKKDNYPLIYIKYVHQLQNLYFALTSEELTIKE
jgi:hypothetical protein